MADEPHLLSYASPGPRYRWHMAGRVRWIGLVVFGVGLSVYIDWGNGDSTDALVSRWGLGAAVLGAVVYLEGLAASIKESATPSPPQTRVEDAP